MRRSVEQAQNLLLGWLSLNPSGRVPVWAFALRTELRFAFTFGRPLMIASLTFPVPNNLFYFSHERMLSEIIYYVKSYILLDGLYYLR